MDFLEFVDLQGSWELVLTNNQPDDAYTFMGYQNYQGIGFFFGVKFTPDA